MEAKSKEERKLELTYALATEITPSCPEEFDGKDFPSGAPRARGRDESFP
jgi:hypothetical protein